MRGSVRTLTFAFILSMAAGLTLGGGAAQAGKFKVLHSFCQRQLCNDGSNPSGPLTMDAAGNFYGVTANGGRYDEGTVFELEKKPGGGFKFQRLYEFCHHNLCTTGRNPNGALVIDTGGNLYGVANNVVFELSPGTGKKGGWGEKVLYDFCSQQSCPDGNEPLGGLTYTGASSGTPYNGISPLYGVTGGGGANDGGTVFELTNNGGSWIERVLYDFCSVGGKKCTDGAGPSGGVLLDQGGNLFGTTQVGGNNASGTVYELTTNGTNGWNETVLYSFCATDGCPDGAAPRGRLVADSAGNLFGATNAGGRNCSQDKGFGCGVMYKLVPNGTSSQETVLYAFCAKRDCRDGYGPESGVSLDASGSLFGTTEFGGGNDIDVNRLGGGVVFELSSDAYKVVHSFCSASNCEDGEYPLDRATMDSVGRLFGTTSLGGEFGNDVSGGTVFQLKR